jgi:hypothetical protein
MVHRSTNEDLDMTADSEKAALAARLVSETGISPAQAQRLIDMLGFNWGSLLREARLLAKR